MTEKKKEKRVETEIIQSLQIELRTKKNKYDVQEDILQDIQVEIDEIEDRIEALAQNERSLGDE